MFESDAGVLCNVGKVNAIGLIANRVGGDQKQEQDEKRN